MIYILIIITYVHYGNVMTTTEFNNKQTCENAILIIKNEMRDVNIKPAISICVKK